MRWSRVLAVFVVGLSVVGCQGADDEPVAVELVTSPQFVNRVIPGLRPLALVTTATDEGEAVELEGAISLAGAAVSFVPERILPGEVA